MKKRTGVILFAALLTAISVGCGQEEKQPEQQPAAENETPAESYDCLADWYTANEIDFSEMETALQETISGYTVEIAVEGDLLIYRLIAEETIDTSDPAVMETETEKLEAYYAENEAVFAEMTQKVIEESGVEKVIPRIEVMDQAFETLLYEKEL